MNHFGFPIKEKTLLILGGSLGARTINESVLAGIDKLIDSQVQVIWQTGKAFMKV
jgi:UDP-N-acetylglucosamine--N-acetylmuramyl-(pentapeptide) pyrophosphoryl-undecaprenol N-acetylglucosamine transferase